MKDSPPTRPSLLLRIRNPRDREAWEEFVEIYAPLVYGFVLVRGLQDADAADLTQEVLSTVGQAIHRLEYDPKRGTFRSWLFTVTRNALYDFLSGQRRRPLATGDTGVREEAEQAAARKEESAAWDREYERSVYQWALQRVREEVRAATWQAFRKTAIDGVPAAEVARDLGMSVGAVYVARSRVTARLREHIARIQGENP